MSLELVKFNNLRKEIYFNRKVFSIELYHTGLEENKFIRGTSLVALEFKANNQLFDWEVKWDLTQKNKFEDKFITQNFSYKNLDFSNLDNLKFKNLINYYLEIYKCTEPEEPEYLSYSKKPQKESDEFKPKFNFLDKLFPSKKANTIIKYKNEYEHHLRKWEKEKFRVDSLNELKKQKYKLDFKLWLEKKERLEKQVAELEKKRIIYTSYLNDMDDLLNTKNEFAIIEYAEILLNEIKLPHYVTKNFELDYIPESKSLIINYEIISLNKLQKILKNKSNTFLYDDLDETYVALKKLIFNLSFVIKSSLYQTDSKNLIDEIIINGFILVSDKKDGKRIEYNVFSMRTLKTDFLKNIDENSTSADLEKFEYRIIDKISLGYDNPVKHFHHITKKQSLDENFIILYGLHNNIFSTLRIETHKFNGMLIDALCSEFNITPNVINETNVNQEGFDFIFRSDMFRTDEKVYVKFYKKSPHMSDIKEILYKISGESFDRVLLLTSDKITTNIKTILINNIIKIYEDIDIFNLFIKNDPSKKISTNI